MSISYKEKFISNLYYNTNKLNLNMCICTRYLYQNFILF